MMNESQARKIATGYTSPSPRDMHMRMFAQSGKIVNRAALLSDIRDEIEYFKRQSSHDEVTELRQLLAYVESLPENESVLNILSRAAVNDVELSAHEIDWSLRDGYTIDGMDPAEWIEAMS